MLIATFLSVFSLTLLFASSTDSKEPAGKFWGTECHTETTGGGTSCTVVTEVCNHYVFWIKVRSTATISDILC
ncbi:hypothetical protein ACTS95_10235 [Empedobacter brevis]